jgi:hypothetical protein
MGNLLDFLVDCVDCNDEGVIFWGNSGGEYDSEFCECAKGVSLENDYVVWYASNEMNEYTRELENA